MATNHGFADGNKRTTIILLHLLLQKSGYHLVTVENDGDLGSALEHLVLSVVQGNIDFEQMIEWFEARIRRT